MYNVISQYLRAYVCTCTVHYSRYLLCCTANGGYINAIREEIPESERKKENTSNIADQGLQLTKVNRAGRLEF